MSTKIILREYNDYRPEAEIDTVETRLLARNISSSDTFAEILDNYLNHGMKDYREGLAVGRCLTRTHRSLQASAIRFALGIILGLSEQEYTDARNETPVEMGKKIYKMIEDGDLEMGYMI